MKRLLLLAMILLSPGLAFGAGISRTGTCVAASASCTLSAVNTGDLKIVAAYRANSFSAPSLPAGWTQIDSQIGNFGGGEWMLVGCSVASSGSDTGTGTWTNATNVDAVAYSGTRVGTSGNCNTTGIGGHQIFAQSTTSIDYHAITMSMSDGSSWVTGFCGQLSAANCATAPTGMTNFNTTGAGPSVGGHDTNAGVSSWSQQGVIITSDVWETEVLEILAAPFFITAANNEVATGSAVTVTVSASANQTVVFLAAEGQNTTSTATITDSAGGNTWTQTSSGYVSVSTTNSSGMWVSHLTNAITTVTATWSGGVNTRISGMAFVFGATVSSSLEDSSVNSSNSGSVTSLTSGSLTTTNASDILIFGARSSANQTSFTAGTGYTVPTNGSANRLGMQYKFVTATQAGVTTSISDSAAANMAGIFLGIKAPVPASSGKPAGQFPRTY